jgi:hypothetical protein
MADRNDGNGRVTMALLGQKLDDAIRVLQEVRDCQKEQGKDITALQLADADLSGRIDRTNDRVSVWQAGQAGLSTLLAAIAAWWGSRP